MSATKADRLLQSFSKADISKDIRGLGHRRNQNLDKSVCETAPKSLLWAHTCVPGFEYESRLAC